MPTILPTAARKRLTGHKGPVHALTYSSPNSGSSAYILTGSTDRSIRLFNVTRGNDTTPQAIQTYQGHAYEVLDIAVTSDNTRFASCGGDKSVFLWDVANNQILRRIAGHAGRVNCVCWAGIEEGVLVSGSFDATVKLWDMKSNSTKPLMTLTDAKDSVSDLAVMEEQIAVGCVDGRLRVYDVRMGQAFVDVIGPPITSITATSDSAALLLSTLDSTLRLMDKSNGTLLRAYKSPDYKNTDYRIRSTISTRDDYVLSGSEDGRIIAWDFMEGKVLREMWHNRAAEEALVKGDIGERERKKHVVSAVAWCRTRNEWASAGGDGNVVVWG